VTYVDVDGLPTWHEVHGEGQPVVLLHGAFAGASSWSGQTRPWPGPGIGSTSRSVEAMPTPPTSPVP
jgi:pimeloyl-ACP methyl ester carboxylesterase